MFVHHLWMSRWSGCLYTLVRLNNRNAQDRFSAEHLYVIHLLSQSSCVCHMTQHLTMCTRWWRHNGVCRYPIWWCRLWGERGRSRWRPGCEKWSDRVLSGPHRAQVTSPAYVYLAHLCNLTSLKLYTNKSHVDC